MSGAAPPTAALVGRFTMDEVRNKQVRRSLEALGFSTVTVNPSGGYVGRSLRQLARTVRQPVAVVVVPFLGYSSVPMAWLISRIRRVPLVFDAHILLHDSLVDDRGLVPPGSARARFLRLLERVACHLADVVLVDTPAHLRRFVQATALPDERFAVVPVGSELDGPCAAAPPPPPVRVVYCGNYIPLHGLDHVVDAVARLRDREDIEVTFIGAGQLESRIRARAAALDCTACHFEPPAHGEALRSRLCDATVLLGVFGTSEKARSVVPNKVVDALALGRPVLTARTPAIEAVLSSDEYLGCPPGDAEAIAGVLTEVADGGVDLVRVGQAGRAAYERCFGEPVRNRALADALRRVGIDHGG